MQDQASSVQADFDKLRKVGPLFQAYAVSLTDEEARAAFVLKHGYEPALVKRGLVLVLVGPIEAK